MKYEILDEITSDVMIRAYGNSLEELLENAAEGLLSVICDVKKIRPRKIVFLEVSGENERDLVHNWLSKVLSSIDIENMFFSKFQVVSLMRPKGLIKAKIKCFGDDVDPKKSLTIVKAITYYKYSVENIGGKWAATFVVDI